MQLPLTIPLLHSRQLLVLLVLAHLGTFAVLWPLQLPLPATVLLAAMTSGSAGWTAYRCWRHRFVALHLGSRETLEVESKLGARATATILPQTTVLPGLIVLLLRVGGRIEPVVLPIDAIGAVAHRKLRLWLRWRSSAGA